MTKFWSICRNTFIQAVRQPIFIVMVLATFGVLVMAVCMPGLTMDPNAAHRASDQKMFLALGVTTLLISGFFIAAFSASSAISREIEDRTALTVVSKPVSRATFVLGKFAGVAGAVTVAYYLCSLAFLIVARHGVMSIASDPYDWPVIVLGCSALAAVFLVAVAGNYLFGWNFTTAVVASATVLLTMAGGVIGFIGKGWYIVPFGAEISPQLLVAIAMAFLSVLVLTAVAVAASTRLGQVMTLLACAGVLFLGYLHPFIFRGEENPALRALGWLAPNLRLFDVQDALTREKPIPLDYLSLAAGYCGLYVAGILAAAVALFQRRELEAQTASASLPGAVGLLSWLGRTVAVLTALVAVVLVFSGRQFRSPVAMALEGGTVLAAVAVYALWNCFARGLRWSYWLVLALGVLAALGISACAVSDSLASATGMAGPPAVVAAVLADAILLVLLLPKTRHHFKSIAAIAPVE